MRGNGWNSCWRSHKPKAAPSGRPTLPPRSRSFISTCGCTRTSAEASGPSISAHFGIAHGINAGDALSALAYLQLLVDPAVDRPAEQTVAMTRALQEANYAMCGGTPGALLGAACELGALAAGASLGAGANLRPARARIHATAQPGGDAAAVFAAACTAVLAAASTTPALLARTDALRFRNGAPGRSVRVVMAPLAAILGGGPRSLQARLHAPSDRISQRHCGL